MRLTIEEQVRASNLRIRSELKPPRPWTAMLAAWSALLGELCSLLPAPDADAGRRIYTQGDGSGLMLERSLIGLHLRTWRWMWSLTPCSEARKAAHTLGHAALLIERWRSCITRVPFIPCDGYMVGPDDGKTTLQPTVERARALPEAQAIGHTAESLLRIAAWHIDDLPGAPAPSIPPHERVYGAGPLPPDNFLPISPAWGAQIEAGDREAIARAIVADHFSVPRPSVNGSPMALAEAFAETAIASLPDGPWTMTSQDVSRFLRMERCEGWAVKAAMKRGVT